MKVTLKVILKSSVSVIRVLTLITLTLSVGSCKDRCEKANEDALLQYREPKLIGLWRYDNSLIKQGELATDSGYIRFEASGLFYTGWDESELNRSGSCVWATELNSITQTCCAQDFPDTRISMKFEFHADTLYLFHYNIVAHPYTSGYPSKGIKMVKVQ